MRDSTCVHIPAAVQHKHTDLATYVAINICNSCNMGTRDLPDMYAQSPRAKGIHEGFGHTYQANHECPCYK